MDSYNVTRGLFNRQIREKAVLGFQRRQHVTEALIKRLGLESELQGHTGCVNCLEWNEKGELLASGSDDQHVILWDALRHTRRLQMHTGHTANIFSVKFLPHSGDRLLITGAADYKVHVHDVTVKEILHIFDKHTNRVKRIATATTVPHMFWSAGEDGTVRQFDLRETNSRSQVLIDLTAYCGSQVEAKCLAINPRDNSCLAVGANDPYMRLYDLRMIHNHGKGARLNSPGGSQYPDTVCSLLPESAIQYFIAGHLPSKQSDYQRRFRTLAATYVTFSPDGTELLVNMGGEQIYLFDLYGRQRPYCFAMPSSCSTTPPGEVQNGKSTNKVTNGLLLYTNGLRLPGDAQPSNPSCSDLPPAVEQLKQQANEAFARQQWSRPSVCTVGPSSCPLASLSSMVTVPPP
uniref:WD and tetratricopeptide repeats 1 n=1 Tax=Eptatretus burgeri TaxID=7764 RepID=A0A8C4QMH6_EPTBU